MTKNILKSLIFTLLFALTFNFSTAQEMKKVSAEKSKTMIETIAKATASVKTIQCDFNQTKKSSMLSEKITSKGKMYFSNGKIRWEYSSPYNYIFIFDGNNISVKSGDNTKKVDSRNSQMFKGIMGIMSNSITGNNLSENKDFSVEMYESGDKWVAKMTPKQAKLKKMFTSVDLYFGNSKKVVEKIIIREANSDETTISFSNIKTNEKNSDKIFVMP